MKTVTDNFQLPPYISKMFDMYFGGKSFAVFDIETTGLSPACCSVILAGVLTTDGENCRIVQYFAEHPDDEQEIIEKTAALLNRVDVAVTYNGRHFDIPFMRTRANRYGLTFCPNLYVLDLFLIIQGHSELRRTLPDLKQKTIEIFMGLSDNRDDMISGGEIVSLYSQYLQTRAETLEKTILLHNHDDLIQLYRILPVIAKTDFHRAMYKLGFPAGDMLIQKIEIKGRSLCALGRQKTQPKDYISFPTETTPYTLTMNSADCTVELTLPCSIQSGALYFDARTILGSRSQIIENDPSVIDGFLIVQDHGTVSYMAINRFLLTFFCDLSV